MQSFNIFFVISVIPRLQGSPIGRRNKNSRSLKGSASIAVHLHTFGSRYLRTPNPPSDDESFPVLFTTPATHPAGQNRLCLTLNDTVFIGTPFTDIFNASR
ncbi:hypothetical protein [Xenorhabdus bovienii]|uniref:hypothetical protein n=1 Tax=Xenorhabdus bovienii TaxID=40576 RepID=UPI003DA316F9